MCLHRLHDKRKPPALRQEGEELVSWGVDGLDHAASPHSPWNKHRAPYMILVEKIPRAIVKAARAVLHPGNAPNRNNFGALGYVF